MMPKGSLVIFETLSIKHLDRLLQFELENKTWFESKIPPRECYFYSSAGLKIHIFDSMINMRSGTHYSGVLLFDDKIVARANLKDMSLEHSCATVGYRVAKECTGKGYASYCLSQLIQIANECYCVNELKALVLDNNPASKAVLKKLGFNAHSHEDDFIAHRGTKLGCTSFSRTSI